MRTEPDDPLEPPDELWTIVGAAKDAAARGVFEGGLRNPDDERWGWLGDAVVYAAHLVGELRRGNRDVDPLLDRIERCLHAAGVIEKTSNEERDR